MVLRATQSTGFGGLAARDSMINRNALANPFRDPTHRKSPSPQKYQNNTDNTIKKNMILSKVGSSMPQNDDQQHHMFSSGVTRDILNNIPNDTKASPGPGSYDVEIQEKLRTLSFHLSSRYQMRPFGSGSTRFEGIQENDK